jgi:hypothetical protein
MRHAIEGYRNVPGQHCGSTAMRNLLAHYCGLDLSEEAVFGLGSWVDLLYVRSANVTPSVLVLGRSVTMETDVTAALAVDYREQPDLDDEHAWSAVRAEVAAGRPTMLSGDALYLTYRDFKVHFPAHRFVLLGFDDEAGEAWIADRIDAESQLCPLDALRRSRNPPDFISTFNLWGRFHDAHVGRSLPDAFAYALGRSAKRMLGQDGSQAAVLSMLGRGRPVTATSGLNAIRELAGDLPDLCARADGRAIATYAANCMESYGTGGGNFRRLFAGFLREARGHLPDLVDDAAAGWATESADAWTETAKHLLALDGARAAASVRRVLELETRLFESLAS